MATPQPAATAVLGAGAPNAPLMSGFLAAVYERNKTFSTFFTAGGGGLIGLSLVAPKLDDPLQNVAGILNCAVHDAIYEHLPMNYKVFRKNSPLMEPMQKFANLFKPPGTLLPTDSSRRLYSDLIDLWAVMMTPGGMPRNKDLSICAPFALLPTVVDFDKLKDFTGQYFLNAYNIVEGQIDVFGKEELDTEHFVAGLSYPFIYPPGKLNGNLYYEGADIDPMCVMELTNLMQHEDHQDHFPPGSHIIVLDILGTLERAIVRPAESLWDAYGISMLTSIVSSARWSKALFRQTYMIEEDREVHLKPGHHETLHHKGEGATYRITTDPGNETDDNIHTVHEIRFDVPQAHWPELMTWSYSNLELCFNIGKETGHAWLDEHMDVLPDKAPGKTVNVVT